MKSVVDRLTLSALSLLALVAVLLASLTGVSGASSRETARSLYEHEQFGDAERVLKGHLAKSPQDMPARLLLGWSLWSQERYDEALLVFVAVLHEAPSYRVLTWEEANALGVPASIGQVENPDLAWARLGVAWTSVKKGWPRTALAEFERLYQLAPAWDAPSLGRGYARLALGDLEGAAADFTEYLQRTSEKGYGERALADLLVARGRRADAVSHYERALVLKPRWADAQSALAWTYVAVGREADAERLFTALRPARPVDWEAGMARLALTRGRFDEAEVILARALAAAPSYGPALETSRRLRERRYGAFDRAWALYREGKAKEAVTAFEPLTAASSGLPEWARRAAMNGLGWSRLLAGEVPLAEQAFRAALATEAKDAEAMAGLGWVAVRRKDWGAAETAFAAAARLAPALAPVRDGQAALRRARYGAYDAAWQLYWAGKSADALAGFRRLRSTPGDLPADMGAWVAAGIAWSQLATGDLEGARRAFSALVPMSGALGAEGEAGLGWVALRAKDPAAARRHFRAALALVPGHAPATRGLRDLTRLEAPRLDEGWTAYAAGRHAEAREHFRTVVEAQPIGSEYHAEALRGLAWASLRAGDGPLALATFTRLAATDADALFGQGLALDTVGRHGDAVETLTRAAGLAPKSSDILVALGWARLRSGDSREAEQAFLRAYDLAPASAEVNRGLAWARVSLQRPAEALAAFRYALGQAPALVDDGEFRRLTRGAPYQDLTHDLAWAHVTWHGFERARALFEALTRGDPRDGDARFGLGYALYRLGRYGDADRELRLAVAAKRPPAAHVVWVVFPGEGTFPILLDAWAARGWVALFAGEPAQARDRFMEAVTRTPTLVSALAGLGLARQRTGDLAGAREAFLRAGEIYPTYPVVVAGLRETRPPAPGSH